jgi:branched-chain amino acid transport system ATP-binding protein
MEALKVENLTKSFKGLNALSWISLSVGSGERTAIIGPNGAGKTTFINLVSGVLRPETGRIHLFGREATKMPPHKRAHLGLGRSFQLNTLFFELTILDNALLALQGTRLSCLQMLRSSALPNSFLAQAKHLLEPIGLWEKKDVQAKDLSHGEQRQLEICLSMASGAKLLLLDEPSAGLAVTETAILTELIRNLPREVAVIFSAHDLELVFSLANRIVILHQGQIVTEGTPEEVRVDLRVREIYLGGYGSSNS